MRTRNLVECIQWICSQPHVPAEVTTRCEISKLLMHFVVVDTVCIILVVVYIQITVTHAVSIK